MSASAGTVAAAMLLAGVAGVAGFACAAGPAEAEDAEGVPDPELRLSLSTGDEPPVAGSPVVLELTLTNEGEAALILDFPDAQRFDFEVLSDDDTVAWRWAEGRFFAQVLGRETLDPGASLTWTGTIEAGLPAGAYRVVGTLTAVERKTIEATLTVLSGADDA